MINKNKITFTIEIIINGVILLIKINNNVIILLYF
jgi:hypothetical protein